MTIQDLGSIGEFVGAVATVATLLYLAFQIRQNSHLLRTSIVQADHQGSVEIQRIIAGDSAAARIMQIGLRDPSALTDEERFQFGAQMGLIFAGMDQSAQLGSLEDRHLRDFIEQPGALAHWELRRELYSNAPSARIQGIRTEPAAQQSAAANSARAE